MAAPSESFNAGGAGSPDYLEKPMNQLLLTATSQPSGPSPAAPRPRRQRRSREEIEAEREERRIRRERRERIQAERTRRKEEYQARKARRENARNGGEVQPAPREPTHDAMRGYNALCWCEKGRHMVRENLMAGANICIDCKA